VSESYSDFRDVLYQQPAGELPPPPLALLAPEELESSPPQALLEGLLRPGQVMLIGGHSKKWKSYALRDLYYCVANGLDWLIFPTQPGLVVDIDLECEGWDLRRRYCEIQASYGKGDLSNLRIAVMRGVELSLTRISTLPDQLRSQPISILGIDPIYRLLAGKSESDSGVVTEMMNLFLRVATQLSCAIATSHHFSKGGQADKEAIDRFSGTGVWGRHPDALVTFTQHNDQDCFTVNFSLRSFASPEPFVVHWDYPRFYLKPSADPEDLRRPPPGRPRKNSTEDICALIPSDTTCRYTDWLERATRLFSISENTFKRRLKAAKEAGIVYRTPTDEYGLSIQYLSQHKNGA